MRKLNVFFKVFIALFAIGLIFTSCGDDDDPDPNVPNDITIPIDDNSAFNMKNFITSFDQLFVASERWMWDFSHEYTEGLATKSYQNYKIHGKFHKKVHTITHNYNTAGVIISSERNSKMHSDIIKFEYKFDTEGFITELKKYRNETLEDIVAFEYNNLNQLIKKTHLPTSEHDNEWAESFTYNTDGNVATYTKSGRRMKEYIYSNGNMITEKIYLDGSHEDTETYEYDNQGRAIKKISTYDNWSGEVTYSSDVMTMYEYEDNTLIHKDEYEIDYKKVRSYRYEYDDADAFDFCRLKEFDENSNTYKKSYYEGSIESLQLIGYTIIDSRDDSKGYKKTKESVYNASGSKLYYAEFTLSQYPDGNWYINETNWFDADGNAINEGDITENWVFTLIR